MLLISILTEFAYLGSYQLGPIATDFMAHLKCHLYRKHEITHLIPFRYDHLVDVVQKILSQSPPDVVDNFEQYSWEVKQEKFRPNFDLLNDIYLSPPQLATVRQVDEMFRVRGS